MITDLNPPKEGSKEAKLVYALSGKAQSVKQLTNLLDWQPHTVRAAFTRLRQRGYLIERTPKDGKQPARFRIKDAAK